MSQSNPEWSYNDFDKAANRFLTRLINYIKEKIANNVVWNVKIHSQIESDKVSAEGNKEQHHYILECFSENFKSDLKYIKRSFIVYHYD